MYTCDMAVRAGTSGYKEMELFVYQLRDQCFRDVG